MAILLFILVLTFLILIHELGHFVVARVCRVHIEEFGIGLPPKALTLFHWRGIPITLNWIFMGGFVRMEGEDGSQSDPKYQVSSIRDQVKRMHPFYTRSLLQKLAIVVAGPFVNFAFGVIVFACIFSVYGVPTKVSDHPILAAVAAEGPAQKAGLLPNDQMMGVGTNQELIALINAHRGETLTFHIIRNGQSQEIQVYARKVEETPKGQGAIGIELKSEYEIKQYPLWQRPFRGGAAGLSQSFDFGKTILSSLGSIGQTVMAGKVPKDVSGPVGIASQVQKEGVFSNGWLSALNFAALLSINLAVMNLLPIPALDGGRAILLLVEKVVAKKKFQVVSYWLNTGGFVLLLSLLVLITVKDVISILL